MDLEWSYAILGTLDPQNLVQVNALSINYQDFSWQLAFVLKVKGTLMQIGKSLYMFVFT